MTEVSHAPERFQLENDSIVFDEVEGETVIMNLSRGTYYALNPAAGCLWQMIVREFDMVEIAERLQSLGLHVDGTELENFTRKLLQLNLIVPKGNGVQYEEASGLNVPLAEWHQPSITEYSDMKDLLAMDPPLPAQTC